MDRKDISLLLLDYSKRMDANGLTKTLRSAGYKIDVITSLNEIGYANSPKQIDDYKLMIVHPNPNEVESICPFLNGWFSTKGKQRIDVLYYYGNIPLMEKRPRIENKELELSYDEELGFYWVDYGYGTANMMLKAVEYLIQKSQKLLNELKVEAVE